MASFRNRFRTVLTVMFLSQIVLTNAQPEEPIMSYQAVTSIKRNTIFMRDYEKSIVPVLNQNHALDVLVQFSLYNIVSVTENSETITLSGYLDVVWVDEILSWNPMDNDNCTSVSAVQHSIWIPPLLLSNSVAMSNGFGNDALLIELTYDGRVTWRPFLVLEIKCAMDVYYYPFDEQDCALVFFIPGYTTKEVQINASSNMYMDQFNMNSEWIVTAPPRGVLGEGSVPKVTFNFKLVRRSGFVVVSNIIPVIMLAILNVSVFMLPNSCGEKASYAITVFLSFAILMTVILATFPRNATIVSVFARYVLLQTVQSTVIALIALLFVRLSSLGEEGTPVYPVLVRCAVCRMKRKNIGDNTNTHGNKLRWRRLKHGFSFTKGSGNVLDKETSDYTWDEVLNYLDKVCFVLFTLIVVCTTLVFFIVVVFKY